MSERVLAVVAHPDDEVLGCGGALWTHACAGDRVHILIVAEGATSRGDDSAAVAKLRQAAGEAARALGADAPVFAGMPDNRLDSVALLDVVQRIEASAREFSPTVVYTHHPSDCNLDHTVVHRAALAAFRPLPGASCRSLRLFETLSSSEWGSRTAAPFRPQWFVPLSEPALAAKLAALACYRDELRPWPHPRCAVGVRHLAALRGSAVGATAAEAFALEYHLAGSP